MASSNHQGMGNSLKVRLPSLTKAAVEWAKKMEREGQSKGKPLAFWQVADALDVGVIAPDRVRVCLVDDMPQIGDPELSAVAAEKGFLGRDTLGITLGYVIFMRKGHAGLRALLRHELRHVAQCEKAGGLDSFIPAYLTEIVSFGYRQAPYEVDARQHEVRKFRGKDCHEQQPAASTSQH